jgi:CRISPR-associated endoribonuclease Cas6
MTPDNPDYGAFMMSNLLRKQNALAYSGIQLMNHETNWNFKILSEPRRKGIHIKEGTINHTQVIGYLGRFKLEAPIDLHEVGYYAGFGEKNSMGFGCVGVRG